MFFKKTNRATWLISLLIILFVSHYVISPFSHPAKSANSQKKELYPVTKIIDGDTIQIQKDGNKETIRMIGVDTPETIDPRKSVQCFGKEAAAKTTALLTGQQVQLETDPTQGDRDRYHRLLAYIFLPDGTFVNKQLIAEGYAYEYTYATPYQYQEEFKKLQIEAEQSGKGLWASNTCNGEKSAIHARSMPQQSIQKNLITQYTCEEKTRCEQMSSCEEAKYYVQVCGMKQFDKDRNGVPCEHLCN